MNRIHRTIYCGIIHLLFIGLIFGPIMAFVPSPENPVTIGE
jgi:hypothetical protein